MNFKKQKPVLFSLVLIIVGLTIVTIAGIYEKKNLDVELLVKPLKSSYILGEIAEFQVTVKNNSSERIVHRGISLASYSLILKVAGEDGVFKKHNYYRGYDVRGFIKAGDSKSSVESVLWNAVPSSADTTYIPKDIILSNFVFPEAGVYYLKFQLLLPGENSSNIIESNTTTLVINEPIGENAKVWKIFKDRDDIALFMQSGGSSTRNRKKVAGLLSEVENLINNYPESVYTIKLKASKSKYFETQEKIKKSEALKEERERKLREKLRKGEPLVPETIDNF